MLSIQNVEAKKLHKIAKVLFAYALHCPCQPSRPSIPSALNPLKIPPSLKWRPLIVGPLVGCVFFSSFSAPLLKEGKIMSAGRRGREIQSVNYLCANCPSPTSSSRAPAPARASGTHGLRPVRRFL